MLLTYKSMMCKIVKEDCQKNRGGGGSACKIICYRTLFLIVYSRIRRRLNIVFKLAYIKCKDHPQDTSSMLRA